MKSSNGCSPDSTVECCRGLAPESECACMRSDWKQQLEPRANAAELRAAMTAPMTREELVRLINVHAICGTPHAQRAAEAILGALNGVAQQAVSPGAEHVPPCERPMAFGQMHPRYPSGWCVACGAAPEEGCIRGGPTEKYPDRPCCKDDQSCCDFCCGN